MKQICKHCGTPYVKNEAEASGFCCAGCEQVYALIQSGGLEGYYALQDRQGQPVGALVTADFEWADCVQQSVQADGAEVFRLSLPLRGMSCMACVWLVGRLARRQPGLHSAGVCLERQRVNLEWSAGDFDLRELLQQLAHFGYRAEEPGAKRVVPTLSPLAWRTLLAGIFALNGCLLAAPEYFHLELSAYVGLIHLLTLLFCFLSYAVGAVYFVRPVWQALRLGKLHYDLLPALGLTGALLVALVGLALPEPVAVSALQFLWLVPLSLAARWSQRCFWEWGSGDLEVAPLVGWVFTGLRVATWTMLLTAVFVGVWVGLDALLALLLLGNLYPLARGISYGFGRGWFLLYFGLLALGLVGILRLSVGPVVAVLWMLLCGLFWTALLLRVKSIQR